MRPFRVVNPLADPLGQERQRKERESALAEMLIELRAMNRADLLETAESALRALVEYEKLAAVSAHEANGQKAMAVTAAHKAYGYKAMWAEIKQERLEAARHAADVRHNAPGGSREQQYKIRKAWASGRYTSRDRCAEEECGAIGMSFSAARKALRNTPNPG